MKNSKSHQVDTFRKINNIDTTREPVYFENDELISYTIDGVLHNEEGAALIYKGVPSTEVFFLNGRRMTKLHYEFALAQKAGKTAIDKLKEAVILKTPAVKSPLAARHAENLAKAIKFVEENHSDLTGDAKLKAIRKEEGRLYKIDLAIRKAEKAAADAVAISKQSRTNY